jgi:hypothetical protein
MKRTFLLIVVAIISLASAVHAFEKPWEKDTGIKQDKPLEEPKKQNSSEKGIKQGQSSGQQSNKSSNEKIIKYTDKKNGFSVMHPERWKPDHTDDNSVLYSVFEKEDENRACAMSVRKLDTDIRVNKDVFMDLLTKEISKEMRIISSNKYSHKIGSTTAHVVEWEAFMGDNDMKAHYSLAALPREGATYLVFGLCDSAIENSKQLVHDAVFSFRLLK